MGQVATGLWLGFTALLVVVFFLAGEFRTMPMVGNKDCAHVRANDRRTGEPAEGFEDFHVLDDDEFNIAFAANDKRQCPPVASYRKAFELTPNGGLWTFPLVADSETDIELTALELVDFPTDTQFHPHGINARVLSDRSVALAVIDHHADRDVVRVFVWHKDEPTKVRYVSTFAHELLRNLNDLQLVGDTIDSLSAYVSNWFHYEPKTPMGFVEALTVRDWSNVVHCSRITGASTEDSCKITLDRTKMSNGVSFARDAQGNELYDTLYVIETLRRSLTVVRVDEQSHEALEVVKRVPLGEMCDNIEWDHRAERTHESLVLACHGKMLSFLAAMESGRVASPSLVLQLDVSDPRDPADAQLLFSSNGEDFGGGSVAALVPSGDLVIGSVFESRGLFVCGQPPSSSSS